MKIKNPAKKATFLEPHQELQRINEKIAKISDLYPVCVGYSEEERVKKVNDLFSQKRKIMQALNI